MVEAIYKELCQDEQLIKKYQHAGVYTISIDDKLVYIGKSVNMLHRLAEHIHDINTSCRHKYKVLRQAKQNGIPINFDVMYNGKAKNPYQEILKVEAYYINKYTPSLNYQIPNLNNPKKYTVNKQAQTITLEEIIKKELAKTASPAAI